MISNLEMDSLKNCFHDQITEPVKLVDVPKDGGHPHHHEFLGANDLESYIDDNVDQYSCRVLYVSR